MAATNDILRTQSPSEVRQSIESCFRIGRPIFVWGPPGIGKSEIVGQIGEDANREVIDVRLSLWEPTDVKGIPFFNPATGKMEWAPPIELPSDPDSTAILFLDELTSAAPATQAAAYQLVLNGRIGTYILPKGVSIVAAGNRDSDKGVTYRMPSPLANRFVHAEMKCNHTDWEQWAIKNQIHEQVIGYLAYSKQDLYDFDPRSSTRAFATPRSWTFVSDVLKDNAVSENTLRDLVAGSVGDGIVGKFMRHRLIANELPRPEDVLAGRVKSITIKDVSAMYSLTISLCYELQEAANRKDKDWESQANYFFRFSMDNFTPEIIVMGAKLALTQYALSFDIYSLPSFDEFQEKYGKFIIAAME